MWRLLTMQVWPERVDRVMYALLVPVAIVWAIQAIPEWWSVAFWAAWACVFIGAALPGRSLRAILEGLSGVIAAVLAITAIPRYHWLWVTFCAAWACVFTLEALRLGLLRPFFPRAPEPRQGLHLRPRM